MKYLYTLCYGFLLVLLSACGAVIEKDLAEDSLLLNAPANGLTTNIQSHTFWWEPLDEVIDGYRLEIVSPSFDSVASLVLREELVEETTFEFTLAPGVYQWAVIAFNSTSETSPTVYDLRITGDSTMDLSAQMLNLVSPPEGTAIAETNVDFLWQTLSNATEYKIQIASPDFSNSTFIIEEQTVVTDNYATTLSEGAYRWRVRAENDQSVTAFSEAAFSVDFTAPSAPNLLSPNAGDTLSLPLTLSWEVDPESIMDTLYVFEDSTLTTPVLQVPTANTSFIFNNNNSEVYYWRLRSVDAAGNTSPFSPLRSFFIE